MIRTTVLLLPESLVSTAVGPMEVFRHAGVVWNLLTGVPERPAFEVTTASVAEGLVACDGPLAVQASTTIADVGTSDLVLIPSTGLDFPSALSRNAPVLPWLREQRDVGAAIAGVCSGVELVAAAGLLDGRPATTHWGLVERLRRRYPAVQWTPDLMVTESGGVYCGAGMYACLDLSLTLVERFCGRDVALQTARAFLIEPPRDWQAGFAAVGRPADHGDGAIAEAESWIAGHFAEPFRTDELCARIGMSPRNFARRFRAATGQTPLEYLHKLRISSARSLLESGGRPVQEVSVAVGYDDVAFFRRLFRRHTGLTPQEYRRRFGARAPLSAVGPAPEP